MIVLEGMKMDKKTEYRWKRGKEMTSRFVRVFEGGIVGLMLLAAAIAAGPRVSQAQAENKVTQLAERLQQIRSCIALYQAEHDGAMPGLTADGQLISADDFVAAMTNEDGKSLVPYLNQIPANPFVREAGRQRTVTLVNDPAARPTGQEGTGWWFNTATGHFAACNSAYHAAY